MFSTTSVTLSTISKAKMQQTFIFHVITSKESQGIKGFVTQTGTQFGNKQSCGKKARSTSTDIGGMISQALKKSSNFVGSFLVASNKFISCLMTS